MGKIIEKLKDHVIKAAQPESALRKFERELIEMQQDRLDSSTRAIMTATTGCRSESN